MLSGKTIIQLELKGKEGGLQLSKLNYKSEEQRLNLSGSQQQGHSTAYNTPFRYLSRMQRIYPREQWKLRLLEPERVLLTQTGTSNIRSLAEAYEYTSQVQGDEVSSLSSMDSDLEAFSHNPTDGSITPLAVQPGVYTNYLNQRFLSY